MANTLKVNLELLHAKFKQGLDMASKSILGFKRNVDSANGSLGGQKKVTRDLESQYYRNQKALHKYGLAMDDLKRSALQFFGIGMIFTQVFSKISNAIHFSTESYKDFQEAASHMQALTKVNGQAFEDLKRSARDTAQVTNQTASEMMNAYKNIALLRPDLIANPNDLNGLKTVAENAVILAQAAKITATESGRAIAMVMNAFNMGANQSIQIINALTAAQTKGSADVQYLTDALEKMGPVASSFGVGFREAIAAIEVVAPKINEASSAGIYLRNVMLNLEKTGDKNLMPSVVGLTKAMENLKARQYDNITLMNLFQRRNYIAGITLLENTDKLKDFTEALDAEGEALRQSEINMNNLAAAEQLLTSAQQELALSLDIGSFREHWVKALTDITNGFTELINKIKGFKGTLSNIMPEWWMKLFNATQPFGFNKERGEKYSEEGILGTGTHATLYAWLKGQGRRKAKQQKEEQAARKKQEEAEAKAYEESLKNASGNTQPNVDPILDLLQKELEDLTNEEIKKIIKELKKRLDVAPDATSRTAILTELKQYQDLLKERNGGGNSTPKKTKAEQRAEAIANAKDAFNDEEKYIKDYIEKGSKDYYDAIKKNAQTYLNAIQKNTDLSKATQQTKDLMNELQEAISNADKELAKIKHIDNINNALDDFEDDTERLDYLFGKGFKTSKEYWEGVKQYNDSMLEAYMQNIDVYNATDAQIKAMERYKKASDHATKELEKIDIDETFKPNQIFPTANEHASSRFGAIIASMNNDRVATMWRNGGTHIGYNNDLDPQELVRYLEEAFNSFSELQSFRSSTREAFSSERYDSVFNAWQKYLKENEGDRNTKSEAFLKNIAKESGIESEAYQLAETVVNVEEALRTLGYVINEITGNKNNPKSTFDITSNGAVVQPTNTLAKGLKDLRFNNFKEGTANIEQMWGSSTRLVDTFKQLHEQWDDMDDWDKFASVGDAIFGTIDSVLRFVEALKNLNTMFETIAATRTMLAGVTATASATEVASNAATTASASADATAQATDAAAKAMNAHSWIPFVGVALGAAAVGAMLATLLSIPKFAKGGIIDGKTTIGDYNLARVNKGEMILNGSQQQKLFNMINDGRPNNAIQGGQVEFKIQGSTLRGVLNNYDNKKSKVI